MNTEITSNLSKVIYTAIPYRVEQGACKEPPVLKTDSLQCEQDPYNESSLYL